MDSFMRQVFKNGPSKICGRQPLKNLKGYGLLNTVFKDCLPQILLGAILNTLSPIMQDNTYCLIYRLSNCFYNSWVGNNYFCFMNIRGVGIKIF